MEGGASLDPGVRGVVFAGRWQCPDCLPRPLYQGNLGTGLMLCAGETRLPRDCSPARPSGGQHFLLSVFLAALRGSAVAL